MTVLADWAEQHADLAWHVRRPICGLHQGNVGHNLTDQAGRRLKSPFAATVSPAVQSNKVYPPQETLDDFRRLGLAADKRYSLDATKGTSMLNGACQCGRIQYEIDGEPRFMYQCFCGKCRAASGASFVTNMIVDTDRFRITAGKESLTAFESSPKKFRHFCSTCGSPIYSHGEKTKHVVAVRCGTLRQDPDVRVAYHAFVASKAPWVDICGDQRQFPDWPDPAVVRQFFTKSSGANPALHRTAQERAASGLNVNLQRPET